MSCTGIKGEQAACTFSFQELYEREQLWVTVDVSPQSEDILFQKLKTTVN